MTRYRKHTNHQQMNSERATWALRAVRAFAEIVGSDNDQEAFGDLMADMRHLADAMKWDFHAALDKSYQHYSAERQEDGPGATKRRVMTIMKGDAV